MVIVVARLPTALLRVVSLTQSEAFEASLATTADSTVLHGKVILVSATTPTPLLLLGLTPAAAPFGARANAMSTIFSRYRFKKLIIRFLSTSNGPTALGVLDDVSTVTGDGPTTVSGISELRCSALTFTGDTVPTMFTWTPVDKSKWYYCDSEPVVGDQRLTQTGSLWAAATVAGSVQMEIDYVIVFKGASDITV